MSTADLYIRVSTDEQADKGYSQRNQEETLRRYCLNQGIEVREVIHEYHSAKTFKRPAWQGYISRVKKHRHRYQGLVLFTKWDRFSRNAGDAYQMINILEALGIEPQAIEQPLDLSIPENKMMLAIYLAAPQVENERRALNVFYGMRRARKEGRFVSAPPVGYGNFNENGRKYIAAKYPQADIMKWAFSEISKGEFTTEQIWRVACKKGLKVGAIIFIPFWVIRFIVVKSWCQLIEMNQNIGQKGSTKASSLKPCSGRFRKYYQAGKPKAEKSMYLTSYH